MHDVIFVQEIFRSVALTANPIFTNSERLLCIYSLAQHLNIKRHVPISRDSTSVLGGTG